MKKIIPMALGMLWLTGCTQPVTHDRNVSTVTPAACCTALNQLPAQSLNGKSSLTLTFDASTPRVAEGSSSARAQVVTLPVFNGVYTLEFTTPLDSDHFLAAQAVVYDANWKPLQKLGYQDFEYRKPALLQNHRLFARMFIQPGMTAPHWLVISTVEQPEPTRLKLIAESEIYAEKMQVEAPLEQTRYATAGDKGTLNIRINRFTQLADELINAVAGK
ncbi:MalM family protein [Klebsiella quasivariicola]|uniref:MalM family protein n=1 Tax=Klebsiella quasivariicola TaxID=2026240 RepID=UPI001CCA95AA|nr:MalM family protein [Klebsiella quasivariicola]MBZ9582949.1 hypothetical protein [Klebsiella quasivariicola]